MYGLGLSLEPPHITFHHTIPQLSTPIGSVTSPRKIPRCRNVMTEGSAPEAHPDTTADVTANPDHREDPPDTRTKPTDLDHNFPSSTPNGKTTDQFQLTGNQLQTC